MGQSHARQELNLNEGNNIVFIGSSSIKMWKNLKSYFPKHESDIIQHGFNGATCSKIRRKIKKYVIDYLPKKVFIYCGDNDFSLLLSPLTSLSAKAPQRIANKAMKIGKKIQEEVAKRSLSKLGFVQKTQVYFLSTKKTNSPGRSWKKKRKFNTRLRELLSREQTMKYLSTGEAVNGVNGVLKADGIHINEKGYDIWAEIISKELD